MYQIWIFFPSVNSIRDYILFFLIKNSETAGLTAQHIICDMYLKITGAIENNLCTAYRESTFFVNVWSIQMQNVESLNKFGFERPVELLELFRHLRLLV